MISFNHHTRNMEWSFIQITLCWLSKSTIFMEISIPFTKFWIRETFISPSINFLVLFNIFWIIASQESIKRSNDGLILWPPEFHVMPILLLRQILAVLEIGDATVLLVITPFPRPIINSQSHFFKLWIPFSITSFFKNKPSSFDGVTRIDASSGIGVDKLTILTDHFEHTLELRFHEVLLQVGERSIDLLRDKGILDGLANAVAGVEHNHADGVTASRRGSITHLGL